MTTHDVVVVGVGAMGSAATYHLARRGHDVLGLERFDVPHDRGSSAGHTRIIRLAYHEHPTYVPLVRDAARRWERLEAETGRDLLFRVGSVTAGDPDDSDGAFAGALEACDVHDLPHEVLDGEALGERFPGFDLPAEYRAVYQPDGGFLDAPAGVSAHVEAAVAAGATVRARERVTGVESRGDGVRVHTDRGHHDADEAVVAAGAWTETLLPDLSGLVTPERQVIGRFQPDDPADFAPDRFPPFVIDDADGLHYGVPIYRAPGLKVGRHHHRAEALSPDDPAPGDPTQADERVVRSAVERYVPGADGATLALTTCVYANSPDRDFIVDRLPDRPITVAAGFSGHGYKFASAMGAVVADLVAGQAPDYDLSPFSLDRFG
ncbi:MAG: N-methyl-L-tryptophan oxidase [Haloplanus sp.]